MTFSYSDHEAIMACLKLTKGEYLFNFNEMEHNSTYNFNIASIL